MNNNDMLTLYVDKLGKAGVNAATLLERYGKKLSEGTFSIKPGSPLTGCGKLLETLLFKVTPYAVRINEILPESIQVDKNKLVKVCLLHHIAKAVRIVDNDNQWEIEKRGIFYKYNNNMPSIRTGLHSLAIAQECGIDFTVDEIEAMTVNDRELTDDQSRYHSSVFASIVRQANELTYLESNIR